MERREMFHGNFTNCNLRDFLEGDAKRILIIHVIQSSTSTPRRPPAADAPLATKWRMRKSTNAAQCRAKNWVLGCVDSRPATRGSQEAGIHATFGPTYIHLCIIAHVMRNHVKLILRNLGDGLTQDAVRHEIRATNSLSTPDMD